MLKKRGFLITDSSRPETCMLKKKKVFGLRSLMTCLSLLDLLCALPACCLRRLSLCCCSPSREGVCHQIPHYGRSACWWTLQGLLLETCCFLLDFFLDLLGTCTSCCPRLAMLLLLFPCVFAPDRQNIVQQDYCWILVVTILSLRNSCCFLSFLSLTFPFPSPQSVIVSVLPFPISVIKICNKLVGPTSGPLFLNLTLDIHISTNLLSLL